MKFLFFLLVIPFVSPAQTIHYDDKEILYEGTFHVEGVSEAALQSRVPAALNALAKKFPWQVSGPASGSMVVTGEKRLNAEFRYIRTLHYTLALTVNNGDVAYKINHVFVTDKRRYGGIKEQSSEKLLEGMEETGPVAIEAERLLNEIDMRLQQLLALLKKELQK